MTAAGWLLDTNVVSELARATPSPVVTAWFAARTEADLFVSVITLGELAKGVAALPPEHPSRPRCAASLVRVERAFRGRVLPVDAAAARRWGAICGEARIATGRWPPPVDALLAAQAIETGLTLATRNTRDVAGLGAAVFDPWSAVEA